MTRVLVALLLLQDRPALPEVTATVDRTRLTVGEELVFTVRARTRSAEPVTIVLPAATGFSIVSSLERTEVSIAGAGGPVRTTVRQLHLRAEQAGSGRIGPVRARQGAGGPVVETDPIDVTIDSAAGAAGVLSPRARALLEASPPPRLGGAAGGANSVVVAVIVPADTVWPGQQVDLVVAAWFPRELRSRLRRAPMLQLPTPEGVWAYPQAAPTGVATSLRVRIGGEEQWMDVFVAHQIVFPLLPGRLVVPPAAVEYAVPVSFSFFSREDRYTLRSDSVAITVLPLPAAGRPASDRGVVGQGLALDVGVEPAETRVGEPIEVVATLSGTGNVALWPEPVLRWPPGFRSYPSERTVDLTPQGGRIAGIKRFRFLVVPDSAGTFVLPEVRYPYYDIAAGAYALARAAPRALAVAPGVEPRAARALPRLLGVNGASGSGQALAWVDILARRLSAWGWVALLVGPPLAVFWRRRRARPAGPSADSPAARLSALGRLERQFYAVLASYVPDHLARDGDGLAPALRAAGVESAVADHVMRLRDRLRAAHYGPRGVGDPTELGAEIMQVLRALGADPAGGGGGGTGTPRRRRGATAVGVGVAFGVWLGGGQVVAQAPGAEALYEAGALRAAADSFAARAAAQPRVAAHWYNLGATLYRAGADGKAIAALTRAARLAPRDPLIRRTRRLLPPPDPASDGLLVVGFASPAEWALVAVVAWIALWSGALLRRGRLLLLVSGGLILAAAVLAGLEACRRARPVAVVIAPATPVRVAPYGGASAAATLEAGAALLVTRPYGPWVEVRRADGVAGWVLAREIVRL
ncbi:MAG: BatD family protein [Gemmatimonadales bacterium]